MKRTSSLAEHQRDWVPFVLSSEANLFFSFHSFTQLVLLSSLSKNVSALREQIKKEQETVKTQTKEKLPYRGYNLLTSFHSLRRPQSLTGYISCPYIIFVIWKAHTYILHKHYFMRKASCSVLVFRYKSWPAVTAALVHWTVLMLKAMYSNHM